jgi:N-methylhydantoinase B
VKLRREIRAQRLGRATEAVPEATAPVGPGARPAGCRDDAQWIALSDRLHLVRAADGTWHVQTVDGAVLVSGSTRWREGAVRISPALPDEVVATLHPELTVTGWACPQTGHLLAVDVHRRDQEPPHDLDLDLTSEPLASLGPSCTGHDA